MVPFGIPLVLGVGDVVTPSRGSLGEGEVRHEAIGCRAVPMPLTGGCVDDIAGSDGDDGFAADDAAFAFGDVEGLAAVVGVPGGAGAGGKWTAPTVSVACSWDWTRLSIQTSPVNQSAGPFIVDGLGLISIRTSDRLLHPAASLTQPGTRCSTCCDLTLNATSR